MLYCVPSPETNFVERRAVGGERRARSLQTLMRPRTYKRRTRSFWRFQALRELISDSMAIDMGSSNTVIAVRGRGVVVDEPSIVAVNKTTGDVVAIGSEAAEMQGREAREVTLVRPVADGVV